MYHSNNSQQSAIEEARPRRKAYHHGNLKKAMIVKALEIIKEEGIAGLSLRKAARGVGVSHAAPAHHFVDLEGLLTAIAEEGFRLLLYKMDNILKEAADCDPLSRLKMIGMSYINFALEYTYYFKVMFSPKLTEKSKGQPLNRSSQKICRRLAGCIDECMQINLIKAGDQRTLALFFWTSIHGYAALAVDGQLGSRTLQPVDGRLAEKMVDLLCAGLQK